MSEHKEQPEASPQLTVSYRLIATVAALMIAGVWVVAQGIQLAFQPTPLAPAKGVLKLDPAAQTGSVPKATPHYASPAFQSIASQRSLRSFYALRAYPGAPPRIPHPIEERDGKVENCLSCHREGGYAPQYKAYAPVTPHPNFTNCVQCHVPVRSAKLFRPTQWKKPRPPKIRRPALAGGPPPVPHTLQLRENCLACHAGPGAVKEIRTPHPDRTNCVQCHVQRQKVPPFKTRYGIHSPAPTTQTKGGR